MGKCLYRNVAFMSPIFDICSPLSPRLSRILLVIFCSPDSVGNVSALGDTLRGHRFRAEPLSIRQRDAFIFRTIAKLQKDCLSEEIKLPAPTRYGNANWRVSLWEVSCVVWFRV